MASQITANLPALDFPKEVDYPTQEDWAAFSAAAELNFGILGNGWSTQMQLWKDQANAMSTELNTNATIAQGLANYQGDWTSKGYTLNQTVSVGGIYYICKLTHATGQNPTNGGSIYWNLAIGNWNLKVNTDMSGYTSKTTPVDADLIPLSDSASTFGIKKLSWTNIKATLKTYFDTLYTVPSSETVSGIIELATTAEAQAGVDDVRAITTLKLFNSLKGSNQSLSANGYQKMHGGLIIQWGNLTSQANTLVLANLPIVFPNSALRAFACHSNNTAPTGYCDVHITTTQVSIRATNGNVYYSYLAIGY